MSDPLGIESPQNLFQIVAHEIELSPEEGLPRRPGGFAVRGMDCELRGRQAEDQPAMADIDRGEFEDVAKERAVRFRIGTVKKNVGAGDHGIHLKYPVTSRTRCDAPAVSAWTSMLPGVVPPTRLRIALLARTCPALKLIVDASGAVIPLG